MALIDPPWRSPDGQKNAEGLRANYSDAFHAVGEIDALGHRLLNRMAADIKIGRIDELVGVALMRRLVTQFVGVRHLFEASAVEPAKLGVRAQFEGLLAVRYLMFGGRRNVVFDSAINARRRESRARYFFVAAERRDIYMRQVLLDYGYMFDRRPAQRRALRREIPAAIAQLDKTFGPQQRAFGPLRCLAKKKSDRRYHDARTWFSFGFAKSKVRSIRALAEKLGYKWEYDVLYAALSGLTHPSGIGHDTSIEGMKLRVFHPYMAEAFPLLCFRSSWWQLYVCMWMAKSYHPSTVPDVQDIVARVQAPLNALDPKLPDGFM